MNCKKKKQNILWKSRVRKMETISRWNVQLVAKNNGAL